MIPVFIQRPVSVYPMKNVNTQENGHSLMAALTGTPNSGLKGFNDLYCCRLALVLDF